MLVLLVAENGGVKSLGPVAAIGVACVLLAGLTLLPAMLAIGGRRAFWPRKQIVAFDPERAVTRAPGGGGASVTVCCNGPAWRSTGSLLVFAIGALGLIAYKEDYSTTTFFKKPTESVDGFKVLERALPAGSLAPTNVLVVSERGPLSPIAVAAARRLAASQPGVAAVTPVQARSRDRRIARFDVIFKDDPYHEGTLDRIPKLRDRLTGSGPTCRCWSAAGPRSSTTTRCVTP